MLPVKKESLYVPSVSGSPNPAKYAHRFSKNCARSATFSQLSQSHFAPRPQRIAFPVSLSLSLPSCSSS
eukprot:2457744-Rhodomonas_salina.1